MHNFDVSKGAKLIEALQKAIISCPPRAEITHHRGKVLTGSSLARAAFSSFEACQVKLRQRRDRSAGQGVFEFIAVKKQELTTRRNTAIARL